jgi:heat shock protein HslJ/phosphoglycolate phosphatase-like HAD superfamily hydrolase
LNASPTFRFDFVESACTMNHRTCLVATILYSLPLTAARGDDDPLPSWNDTDTKTSIIAFVEKVTAEGTPDYVPPAERIAVFDNDGTLWAEQPAYFQLLFALDRVREMAPQHPEWQTTEPFQSALAGDTPGLMAGGMEGLAKILAASHANITADEFADSARDWLATAKHPQTGMRYAEMVYQPMLELLEYLRANDFKTFIVSGGGIDFLRVFAEQTYGIPPEQVVGSSVAAKYELRDGVPTIVKQAEGLFVDDKEGKPVGIYQHIGRRPIFAAGNSDGDFQMLEYATAGDGPRFGLLLHHTDAEREFAYDRDSHIGKLDRGLTEAKQRGWVVIDMKQDWIQIWPEADAHQADGKTSIVGEWLVEDIGGKGVVDNSRSTLQIAADGAVSGDGGINRYRGQASVDGQSISFGPLLSTKRGGPPALMDQEAKFLDALSKAKSYCIEPTGLLSLQDGDGKELARLSKVDAQP